MTILPFNHSNDYDFHLALDEFLLGPSKINLKIFSDLQINPTTINNITDDSRYILNEDSDPDTNFLNHSLTNDKYFLDNELNSLLQNLNINNDNSFSVLHVNARSLSKHFESLEQIINSLSITPDFIGISETWLKEPNELIQLENYHFLCEGRESTTGGGVGLYITKKSNFKTRKDLGFYDQDIMESLFVDKINDNNVNTIIGVIYRAPNSGINCFLPKLTEIIEKINSEGKKCYLLGDYNINSINSNESDIASNFADIIIYSSFLKPLITKPTRVTSNTATRIDNILTNDFVNYPACVNGLLCADTSDHIPIFHVHMINNIDSGSKTKRNRKLTRVYNNYILPWKCL